MNRAAQRWPGMRIFHFRPERPPERLETLPAMPDDGFVWLDYVREQAQGWESLPESLLDVRIDSQHVEDSLNPTHVSFFDGTEDYDLVVFESLGPSGSALPLDTRSSALFIFERLLVTVRAADAPSFDMVLARCQAQPNRPVRSAVGLAYRILDTMVDRFLGVREPLMRRVEKLQDDMLHPRTDSRTDWRALMRDRRSIRRLARLAEDQWEAVQNWRRDSRFEWDEIMLVRLNDLSEHITRIRDLAFYLDRDLDSALQLNFAVLAQRQNETMKVFTVMAVVFMPLTLLTGIWGMNFQFMPELHWHYGYPAALALIAACGVGLYWWFKRRNFF